MTMWLPSVVTMGVVVVLTMVPSSHAQGSSSSSKCLTRNGVAK